MSAKLIHVVRRVFPAPVGMANHGLERAFVEAAAARTWVAEEEERERARLDVNPFHFSDDFEAVSSMPAEVLSDWLIDHDYPPYDPDGPLGWEDWWDAHHERFTVEQRHQLWCRLDRVRFFEVVEVPWDSGGRIQPRWAWVAYLPGQPIRPVAATYRSQRTRRPGIRVPLA